MSEPDEPPVSADVRDCAYRSDTEVWVVGIKAPGRIEAARRFYGILHCETPLAAAKALAKLPAWVNFWSREDAERFRDWASEWLEIELR